MAKEKYTIDFTTWRSGGDGGRKIGKGETKLLNTEGYSCCLGQIIKQHNKGKDVTADIWKRFEPQDTTCKVPGWMCHTEGEEEGNCTELAYKMMAINDCETSSISTRIGKLKHVAAENNIELEFINVPEEVSSE